ncbi:hypothetical protein OH768_19695 [Streptomyces sp. NBC_01622]|uniref:hypothetical protein n=1 Tax=Streptomyces sp. NBC_01622 TaxID=2975903 RepID=UPI00386D573A|nr:hypothetical protein OH768_19695 [Streptomyces sp. NBC_01622]
MTTTTKAERAEGTADVEPPVLPRGRHRRPRPRKVLLAAGGLAVAAGVLSLVRLTPESGVGGVGTAEAEPSPDVDAEQSAGHPANAATIRGDPTAIPSATSVMGGASATPATASGVVPTPYATTAPTTVPETGTGTGAETTTAPGTPQPQAPVTAPGPLAPATSAAPEPTSTPPPSRTANSPAPAPSRPGLCVPIIGLCVDPPAHRD